ncbi:MAG: hypothetical protein Q4D16_07930 [Eubacteriales bacterium]|nr:hypothetical protein [Eubacteriales bacterium]
MHKITSAQAASPAKYFRMLTQVPPAILSHHTPAAAFPESWRFRAGGGEYQLSGYIGFRHQEIVQVQSILLWKRFRLIQKLEMQVFCKELETAGMESGKLQTERKDGFGHLFCRDEFCFHTLLRTFNITAVLHLTFSLYN